jgi:hypothetical protein
MDEFLKTILTYMGIYTSLILAVILIINFLTKGFLFAWMKAKKSRDKKLLVKVRNVIHDFFVVGTLADGMLTYAGSSKKEKILSIPDGSVYRSFGVFVVDIDEEKNCVNTRDFKNVSGFDAERNKSLHLRALYAPTLVDGTTKIILGLCAFIIILLIVDMIISNSNKNATIQAINALGASLKNASVSTTGITTGGV